LSVVRLSRLVCLGLFWALALCGCAAAAAETSLSDAEDFDAFRLYYAGEEAADLRLENVLGGEDQADPLAGGWTFVYGTCDPPEGEGGCAPPIEVQNFSVCKRYAVTITRGYKLYDFRGAKARGGYEAHGFPEVSPMEIFTGRTTIVIWGYATSTIKAVARQLRQVGAGQPQLRLPPPVPGSLQGRLPCQHKRR
jgi:hypothetical protein